MNSLSALLLNNDALDAELEAFCNNDPEYQKRKQHFYDLLDEIAPHINCDLENAVNAYLFRTADLYYLFGLGFRQELLRTIGADG